MRIIRRTFANLPGSILLLGRAGENNVTKLELDVSKEQSEFKDAAFELVLKTPASEDPYPVVVEVKDNKLTYNFSGSDLAKSGYGQLEAMVVDSEGNLLKSATAKIKIDPSIIPNTYPGPLQKVIEDMKEEIGELEAYGIKTVTELPDDPDDDEIVYLNAEDSGFYRWDGTEWVMLTDDNRGLAALANKIDKIAVVEKYSDLNDSEYDDAFVAIVYGFDGNTDKRGVYVNESFWQNISDVQDVEPLAFRTYNNLYIRDEVSNSSIQDVPVYVSKYLSDFVQLYDASGNYIALAEVWQNDGTPIRFIKTYFNDTYKVWFPIPQYDQYGEVVIPAGWSENRVSTSAPSFEGFTPVKVEDCNGTDYYGDLPDEVRAALNSLSQCINVSADAMGHINIPDDAVVRFNGTIEPNRKYFFPTSYDLTITLPSVQWAKKDAQFVLYLNCVDDIDITLPSDIIVTGSINSDAGNHKILGSFDKTIGKWCIGSIDYEVAQ